VGDLVLGQGGREGAAAVARAVIGQHPPNCDAMVGEEPLGAPPEPRAALVSLVVQQLDIGQPGVVVDRSMQVVIADPPPPWGAAAAAVDAVAAPAGMRPAS
jgi:hypothetical protein